VVQAVLSAHGGGFYRLKHDFTTALAAVEALPPDQAADGVFDILWCSRLREDEEKVVIDRAADSSGRSKRALLSAWKTFKKSRQAEAARARMERGVAGLPVIYWGGGALAEATTKAIKVMAGLHPPTLFQRGPFIARVINAEADHEIGAVRVPRRSALIRNLNAADCQLRLAQISTWIAPGGKPRPINPPGEVVQAVLSAHGAPCRCCATTAR
jgi:hypothetical protein